MCSTLMGGYAFDVNQRQISYDKKEKYSSMTEQKQCRISTLSNVASYEAENRVLFYGIKQKL